MPTTSESTPRHPAWTTADDTGPAVAEEHGHAVRGEDEQRHAGDGGDERVDLGDGLGRGSVDLADVVAVHRCHRDDVAGVDSDDGGERGSVGPHVLDVVADVVGEVAGVVRREAHAVDPVGEGPAHPRAEVAVDERHAPTLSGRVLARLR